MISVVIPVKNGGEGLVQCLAAIRMQAIDEPVEIVIVDSGSTDGSLEAARAADAVIREIHPIEFTHGGARNLGASIASGDVLAFISQDAIPVDTGWLAALTSPLRKDESVAGVYGRQLPHPDATPPERYFLGFLYGERARVQRVNGRSDLNMETVFFSNVNAAMPHQMWERYRFVDDLIMSEDQEWSRRVLLNGFKIAYEPSAAVRHSHNYTVRAAFRRFFDSGVSSAHCYLAGERDSSRVLRSSAVRYALGELEWLRRSGEARWIPYAGVYESAKMLGLVLGANHERLPIGLKRRFSALSGHWG